ncbi:hypothetical protein D4R20_02280 [bacterium]|nr:MAG: hypothetical protein D4R20_02280 [bacterium]
MISHKYVAVKLKRIIIILFIPFFLFSCSSIKIRESIDINASEDWITAGGTPELTNISRSKALLKPPFKLAWSFGSEAAYSKNCISASDGVIFISNLKGEVIAIDIITGKSIGSFSYGKTSYSTPIIYKNRIIASFSDITKNTIVSYNLRNGSPDWERRTGEIYSSPVLADGGVFFSTKKGNIVRINPDNGNEIWTLTGNNFRYKPVGFFTSPAVYGNCVIAGSIDSNLYCIDVNNGSIKWKYKTSNNIFAEASCYKGKVFFGSDDMFFYCVDTSGILSWKDSLGTKFNASSSFYKDNIIVTGINGAIYSIKTNDGTLNWKYQTQGSIWTSPLVHGDLIFIGSFDKNFYCLDAVNGNPLWKYETEYRVRTSAVVWKNYIIVAGDDKEIYCFK